MPLRFPGSKSYTDEELNQIEGIQRYYTQDVHTELHEFLQLEEDGKKPRYSATLTDLERQMFQSRIGTGLLAMECENILVNILQYQTSRQNRDLFRSGYLNDPRNLLCELLKHFVVETLSHAEVNPELLITVDKWTTFIHHLTMSSVFKPNSKFDETMEALLVALRNSFRYQVRPALNKHLATSSAREHLHWFIQSAKRVLSHGTQFLYFVLRNSVDTPKNCTIPNIQIGHKPLDVVLSSGSGRLLQAMVLSAPFQKVFPIGYVPGGLSPVAEQLLRANIQTFGTHEDGRVTIPPILAQIAFLEQQQKDARNKKRPSVPAVNQQEIQKSMTEVLPTQFLRGIESGISKPFREKPAVLDEFVKLHELFIRIASLIQLLEQAYSLAGEGGDLLVYGVTRKNVARLVVDYTLLSNAVRESIYIIEKHADGLYQHLVRENVQAKSVWKFNYMQVSSISMLLNEDLEKCHEAAYRVRQQATQYSLTMQQRLEQLRGNLNSFITDTDNFSKEIRSVLQLKGAEQADLLLDAEIPQSSILDSFGIQYSNYIDYETDDDSNIVELPTDKEPSSKRAAVKKIFKGEPSESRNPPPEPEIPPQKKEKRKREIPAMRITEIRPGLHPLSGISTQISGCGFSDYLVLKVGNTVIEGHYVQDDGPRKIISFASPPSDKEGTKKIRIINPDGETAIASITYYDETQA